MKLDTHPQTLTSEGDYIAQIDKNASGLVMDMLATLYTHPMAACIREYVSNAVDAQREVGCTDPVDVFLPSAEKPELIVSDKGAGLSSFDVMTIFGNFGTSTKRDTDELIGGFGIGSKSGLAVCDEVHVTSVKSDKLTEFVLRRTPDKTIVTTFIQKDVCAHGLTHGTTIKLTCDASSIATPYVYLSTLAGWSSSYVLAHSESKETERFVNENRIPDTWHEWEHGYTRLSKFAHNSDDLSHGALINGVLYTDLDWQAISGAAGTTKQTTRKHNKCTERIINTNDTILKLDIARTKISYSRETIELTHTNTLAHTTEVAEALEHEIRNALNTIKCETQDPFTYVKRAHALGIDLARMDHESSLEQFVHYNTVSLNDPIHRGRFAFYTIKMSIPDRFACAPTLFTRPNTTIMPDAYAGALICVADNKEFGLKAETLRRKINDALNCDYVHTYIRNAKRKPATNKTGTYPALDTLGSYLSRVTNPRRKILLVNQETFDVLWYRERCSILNFSDLVAQTRANKAQTSSVPTKSEPVYYTLSPGPRIVHQSGIIKGTTTAVMIIDHDSQFAFNTREIQGLLTCTDNNARSATKFVMDLIRNIFGYDMQVCAKTRAGQTDLEQVLSNHGIYSATVDDAGMRALIEYLARTYGWLGNDTLHYLAQLPDSYRRRIGLATSIDMQALLPMRIQDVLIVAPKLQTRLINPGLSTIIGASVCPIHIIKDANADLRMLVFISRASRAMNNHISGILNPADITDLIKRVKSTYSDEIALLTNLMTSGFNTYDKIAEPYPSIVPNIIAHAKQRTTNS